jgi:midasin
MRFLSGLELLLGTAQDWESSAHAGVSLATSLADITDIVIAWRKLELQCWKNLLQITQER